MCIDVQSIDIHTFAYICIHLHTFAWQEFSRILHILISILELYQKLTEIFRQEYLKN